MSDCLCLYGIQCLRQVGKQIVDMLDTHAQAYHVRADACCGEFCIVKLTVGRCGRMGSQRFGIADIHQTQEELQCVNEFRAGFRPPLIPNSAKPEAFPP